MKVQTLLAILCIVLYRMLLSFLKVPASLSITHAPLKSNDTFCLVKAETNSKGTTGSFLLPITIDLLYISTSFLWWQAVVGTIVIKSSNPLRMHGRCIGRSMQGLRNVHHTVIRRTRSPSRPCGSVTAGVHSRPPWVVPSAGPHRNQGQPGGRTREEKRHYRSPGPLDAMLHDGHVFASSLWSRHTGYSSETIDMTVH